MAERPIIFSAPPARSLEAIRAQASAKAIDG